MHSFAKTTILLLAALVAVLIPSSSAAASDVRAIRTYREFGDLLTRSKLPVLVIGHSIKSARSKVVLPIVEKIAGDFKRKVNVFKVDMDTVSKDVAKAVFGDRLANSAVSTDFEFLVAWY
jgi:hypothetical protein